MAGTSIIVPEAAILQANVLASCWTPNGIVQFLKEEFALGVDAATSGINHANLGTPATLIGTPTFNAASAVVSPTAGFNTNEVASEIDQTFVVVCKQPAGSAGVYAAIDGGGWIGFLYNVSTPKFGFYNSLSGAGPGIPEVTAPSATNYNFIIGWGSQGGVGHIRAGSGGALGTVVNGTSTGASRLANTTRIGSPLSFGSASIDIAFAARVPLILSDTVQLAWYLALQDFLGRAGIIVA